MEHRRIVEEAGQRFIEVRTTLSRPAEYWIRHKFRDSVWSGSLVAQQDSFAEQVWFGAAEHLALTAHVIGVRDIRTHP
ncbi:hypothetical protein AW168_39615 [Nocardia brasiliensis]|nr:hypothetical protein AW168_39615 [Nocardia brasiliensis]